MMTPRENLLRVVDYEQPEWIPTWLPLYELRYVGAGHESWDGSGGDGSPAGARWTDVWGVGWRKKLPDVMGLVERPPLADLSRLDEYPFPDPRDRRLCGSIWEDPLDFDRGEFFLSAGHRDTLFEQAYMLVGMERLMLAFYDRPVAVRELLHRIIDFHLGLAEQYVERGVEWATMGDDLGCQRGLLFGRRLLEEFFVPEYRRLLGFYKQHGVRLSFHSCGQVQDIVDIFIDLGVDVLNPVQASANDLAIVRERTQGRMTLMGAVPSHVVMAGPSECIRAEVRKKIALLWRGGGYICSPDQGLPFPKAHLEAWQEAVAQASPA